MRYAKNKWNANNKSTYRGYFPVQESAVTSYKEGFEFGLDLKPDDQDLIRFAPFHELNIYPENSPQFRNVINTYFQQMSKLGDDLMEAIALGFELPQDHFANLFNKPISTLRLLRYPLRTKPVSSHHFAIRDVTSAQKLIN
jgi:isopenicillin N synthase-like dioxygenase